MTDVDINEMITEFIEVTRNKLSLIAWYANLHEHDPIVKKNVDVLSAYIGEVYAELTQLNALYTPKEYQKYSKNLSDIIAFFEKNKYISDNLKSFDALSDFCKVLPHDKSRRS